MEIIRIPSSYYEQLEYVNDKDFTYIQRTLYLLCRGDKVIVEKSMRGGLVISMYREALQMENKARAKKGEKRLEIDIATLTGDTESRRIVRPSNITSSNITEHQEKENNIYIGASRSEVLEELNNLINYWNNTFSENRKVTPKLESVYLGVRKKYPKDDISNALGRYTKEKLKGDPSYWLDPLRFLTQNNGFVKYL